MYQISRLDIQTYELDILSKDYSPFVYYFELLPQNSDQLIVHKCEFPILYPNEDVKLIRSSISRIY